MMPREVQITELERERGGGGRKILCSVIKQDLPKQWTKVVKIKQNKMSQVIPAQKKTI